MPLAPTRNEMHANCCYYFVADPGFVERGVVQPWDPSKGRVLDQGGVPPPTQCAEAFSNYVHM